MHIVGAGLAGLLAANMLRHHSPKVHETQRDLPNNHNAVLRFRSSIVGDTVGIPFKKVTLIKCVAHWRNPVADALSYSIKNSGYARSDRSINSTEELSERYIAPPELISRLAAKANIKYNSYYEFKSGNGAPTISTIPMPVLMRLLDYPQNKPYFNYMHGSSISGTVHCCDAYVGIAVPDPQYAFSRISITGDHLIIEIPKGDSTLTEPAISSIIAQAAELLGLEPSMISNIKYHQQKYAKILPIDDDVRKEFIYWATVNHNVYSLGRFATWRPGLLLDSLVNDIRLIDNWVRRNDKYSLARAR